MLAFQGAAETGDALAKLQTCGIRGHSLRPAHCSKEHFWYSPLDWLPIDRDGINTRGILKMKLSMKLDGMQILHLSICLLKN